MGSHRYIPLCTLIDTNLCKPDDGLARPKHVADVTSCSIQLSIVLCKDGLMQLHLQTSALWSTEMFPEQGSTINLGIYKAFLIVAKNSRSPSKYSRNFCPAIGNSAVISVRYQLPRLFFPVKVLTGCE